MPTPAQKLFAVVLAAGLSSRFGRTKQTATINGDALVKRAFEAARGACGDRCITVIGYDAAAVLCAMKANSGFVVVNEDYEKGLGSSIAAAARACGAHVDALLLLLADQALVTSKHLRALMDAWSGDADEIVATAYDDTLGPPALLPSATFDELRALSGDHGARELFTDGRFTLKTVRFEPAAVDIDTPEDLAQYPG